VQAYEQSESREFDKDNQDVVEEMYMLEDRLMSQEGKIAYLREIIATGRLKYGIPPIVPLTCVPDEVGSRFMTLQELREYQEYRNTDVETLYKKENVTNRLLTSESQVPFDESRFLQNITEMEDQSEDQFENTEEAEAEEKKYSFTPTGDDAFEEEEYGEDYEYDFTPGAYPINVIPDDQMPQTDPETDNTEEEEEYMSDPIPVGISEDKAETSASESRKTSEIKPISETEPEMDTSQVDETEEEEYDEDYTATENEEEEDFDLEELEQLLRHGQEE